MTTAPRTGRDPAVGSGTELPLTSLIIPSRNRPGILAETVASVLEGEEVPTELIVIDQSDVRHAELGTRAAERGCAIRYIWSPATGLSRARNEGIRAAQHDVLVFTDDDVRVSRSWFGTIVRALVQAGKHALVTGQVPPAEERAGGFVPSTKVDPHPAVYEGRIGADVLYPHNMAMYRSLIDSVGEFDVRLGAGTHFGGSEDNDFAFRLLEAGHRIVYVPEAVVYHRAWRSASDYLPLRWKYGRGQGAFYAKHLHLRDRYMAWRVAHEIRQRSSRFIRLLPREPRRATGQLVCLIGMLSGLAEWLIRRPRHG